jgi:hypothetical protein
MIHTLLVLLLMFLSILCVLRGTALGSDLVCSMLSTGTPEEAADVLKGINADDMGKLLMFMRPQDAADIMAGAPSLTCCTMHGPYTVLSSSYLHLFHPP